MFCVVAVMVARTRSRKNLEWETIIGIEEVIMCSMSRRVEFPVLHT